MNRNTCSGGIKGLTGRAVMVAYTSAKVWRAGVAKDAASAAEGVELDGDDGLRRDGHFAF
jgi:hypothetical protein